MPTPPAQRGTWCGDEPGPVVIRRAMPYSLAPLAVLATALSSASWLRAFPAATLAIPLFGAAVLSVAFTSVLVPLTRRSMLVTVPAGLALLLGYLLAVVLQSPIGLSGLVNGLFHGPAQLLSFALPLVSPRSLMVWPVLLCWLAGLVAGESLARSRLTLIPYASWLIVFGASYAGGSRAMGADAGIARRVDLALGGGLLLVLVLLRVAQSWLQQDASSEAAGQVTDQDPAASASLNLLPLQRILAGTVTALVVVAVAVYLAGTSLFAGQPAEVKRVPSVIRADPTTPLAYVASLRPASRKDPGTALFEVTVDAKLEGYFGLASVDFYDGDSWSFTRDFRPSGGVVPADTDPELDPATPLVAQDYRISSDLLTAAPWMPTVFRPAKVSGVAVSVDPQSGMVVPTGQLSVGTRYQVRSRPAGSTLSELPGDWLPATSAPPVDSELPAQLRTTLASVVAGFAAETGRASTAPNAFLQAVVADLRANYLLADAAGASTSATASKSAGASRATPARSGKAKVSASASAKPGPTATASAGGATGGSSFSAVLAAILGPQRSGTPEQYATLVALVARDLGVPARIVSGFRITDPDGSHIVNPGKVTIGTKDAYSWVEVPVRGQGWVVLDPAPSRYATTEAQPSVGVSRTPSPSKSPSQAALVTEANGGHAVAPKSGVALTHRPHRPLSLLLVVPLALIVLALLVVLVLLGRRWLRLFRRRRVPDARLRVISAWQETLDVLTESGLGDLTTMTGAEVGKAAAEAFGAEPAERVRTVAGAADQAAFSQQSVLVAKDADEAWQAHSELRRQVRRGLPLSERVRSQLRYNSARGRRERPGRRSGRPGLLRGWGRGRRTPGRRTAGRRRARPGRRRR
jgi:hypothetical protein